MVRTPKIDQINMLRFQLNRHDSRNGKINTELVEQLIQFVEEAQKISKCHRPSTLINRIEEWDDRVKKWNNGTL